MKFMVTGRSEGKTTRLMAEALEYAKKFPTVLICPDEKMAQRIRDLYRGPLLDSKLEVLGFQRLLSNPKKRFKRVLIDDAELILAMIIGQHVDEDGGRLTTLSATGIPMQDLDAARAGAVMLWREAELMVSMAKVKAGNTNVLMDLGDAFTKKALDLEASLPEIWKQRLNQVPDNVTNIKQNKERLP